jgi:trimeric autotransporter adhesin
LACRKEAYLQISGYSTKAKLMKPFFGASLLSLAILLLPCCSHAVSGDEHWDSQFNLPGTTNVVFAIATNGGKLYVGGYLNSGSTTNDAVEVWDGLQWSAIGFFSGNTPPVYDLAFMGNTLYAAGTFSAVNRTPMRGLAWWDGTTWTSLGLSGTVQSIAVDNGKLYAAGSFTNTDIAGMVMTNIGYWDGSSWHALGGGIGVPGSSGPDAVVVKNGLVYAGGLFTNSGSTFMTNIAVWNGSAWSQVGSGLGVAGSTIVYCLGFNGSDLYAGGVFNQAGSTTAANIARWDGSNWNPVGSGLSGGTVNSIGVLDGSVCVAGSFTSAGSLLVTNFAVWNGSTWSAAGSGISATGYRVLNGGTKVYVGGNFLTAGNRLANGIATWDGSNWGLFGTPGQMNGVNGTSRALVGDGTNVYIGGVNSAFRFVGQTNINLIARFDGTAWFPLGSGITGPTGGGILSLALDSNVLYAGGYFNNAGGTSAQNIAQWDGTNWSALGDPGGIVASVTVRPDGIYAAGAPFNGSVYGSPFFERWDGATWNNVLNFNPDDTFYALYFNAPTIGMDAVAFIDTNIYVGGHFSITWHDPDITVTTNCLNILRFDGTYARIVGTGLNSNVTSMTVIGTNLYVAGLFTNAGGIAASKIAMWNGSSWTNLGSGVVGSGSINALSAISNILYVGGTITNMGGTPVNRIAKWDGTNWAALGNGVIFPGSSVGSISGLGVSGNDLYAGGNFRMAGNKAAYDISRWNETMNFNTPQLAALSVNGATANFRLLGIAGLTNVVQATTNFTIWTPILTNSIGFYNFADPDAANYRARFYRAVLGP